MKFKEYEMPDGRKAVFEYDENGVGKITLECMDMLMGLINDRKTENSSEKPNNCEHITEDGVTCAKYPACDDCLDNPLNKVKGSERLVKGSEQTEPQNMAEDIVRSFGFKAESYRQAKAKDEPQKKEVEWVYNKRERLWYPYSNGELLFKDKPTTQTETQNSNLTFEKDECAKEYEELGLKELKELIEADRKDEFFREPTAEERKAVADYIDSISAPTGVNIFDLMDEPQTDCYVSDLCKHYGDKQICGRCRSRNLFCEAEPQPRCPKCGKRGYIRSLESMGVKLKVFDEYKWKCTNCNKYFKEEPKDEPQTDCSWK